MEKQMLRVVLEKLKNEGKLKICHSLVDPKFEIGAILKYYKNKQPILFDNVKGSNISIVGGLFGNRDIFYDMLGIGHEERILTFVDSIAKPGKVNIRSDGPVKKNVITRNINIEKMFPIPVFNGKDSSNFITAGIVVIKDPETNQRYTAVRRLQVNSANSLSILVASPMFSAQIKRFQNLNKPLEVAVILGYDYPFLLASQVSSELYGIDKYEIDSALRGEPLDLVKCNSIDLEVPANAEIVLEGVIPPNKTKREGPFGELMGYYGTVAEHPVIEVKCVMHRNDPIFQVSFPCREEHLSNGLIREMELFNAVNRIVDVKDVNVTVGGGYRFHALVSINKRSKGDGKSAILAALGSNRDLKHVVVVDDDVDIFDQDEVAGIIATRVQADDDLVVIPGALGSGLDPSNSVSGVSCKVGVDATKPVGTGSGVFEKAQIPGYEDIDIHKYFPAE